MGDLLISTPDNSDKEIVFPTIGKISRKHFSRREYRPTGFSQKVNLLSPNLAIAWAGTKLYAQCFIREVMEAGLHNNPARDALQDVFKRIEGQGKVSIIGVYRNGKEMCLFEFGSQSVTLPDSSFGWFKAMGTGYASLLKTVSTLESNVTSGQPNKLENGISVAINLTVALLSLEVQTAVPLENLYGAGYEILHPLGSGLAKLCDLTYLFWREEEESFGVWRLIPFPFLASCYSYYEDVLIIRSVRLSSNGQSASCKIESDELHTILPIYRSVREEEFVGYAPASLNTKRMCNIFLWRNYCGEQGAFSSYGYYGTGSPPLIWTNEFKDNPGIDINKQFVQSSISMILSRASSRPPEDSGENSAVIWL